MTAFTVSHPLCMLYLTQKQIQFSLFFSISKYGCVFYMRHLLYFYIECIAFLGRVVALMTLLRAIVRQLPPSTKPLVSHCGSYDHSYGFLLMQKLGATPIFSSQAIISSKAAKNYYFTFKRPWKDWLRYFLLLCIPMGLRCFIHSSRKLYWTSFRVTYYSNEILCPLTN